MKKMNLRLILFLVLLGISVSSCRILETVHVLVFGGTKNIDITEVSKERRQKFYSKFLKEETTRIFSIKSEEALVELSRADSSINLLSTFVLDRKSNQVFSLNCIDGIKGFIETANTGNPDTFYLVSQGELFKFQELFQTKTTLCEGGSRESSCGRYQIIMGSVPTFRNILRKRFEDLLEIKDRHSITIYDFSVCQ